MKNFINSRAKAFKDAFRGLAHVIQTQKNAWIHALATTMVLIFAWWLGCNTQEWAILLLAVGLVWTAEAFNTAIEAAVDLSSPEIHPQARISKDAGAATVLLAAIFSIFVGLFILGPPLVSKIQSIIQP
jgi:diacylglycerol kinase